MREIGRSELGFEDRPREKNRRALWSSLSLSLSLGVALSLSLGVALSHLARVVLPLDEDIFHEDHVPACKASRHVDEARHIGEA